MVKLKVVWSEDSLFQLKNSLKYLKDESPKSASKVKSILLKTAKELSKTPEVYALDRFRKDNDGSFRSFEKYSYRVTYQVKETQILILRVRHTSREPLED
jgi:plasmid stabilization system protein ParE